MEKVLGIGGFFFRAKEPDVLARWYATISAWLCRQKAMINARGNNSTGLPYLPRSGPTVTISAAPSNNG